MKRILSFILSINLIFILVPGTVLAAPSWPSAVSIEADGGILMEAQTGTVLFAKNEDQPYYPASITKIMTLILIFDAIENGKLHLDDTITTSAYAKSMGGSQVFLEEGETQKAETMIKCIVIASGNDASVAMAEYISGTEEAFVEEMNKRAEGLGMTNTHFSDCCGLTEDPDHLTTARDIALMTRELINCYPEIHNYSTIWMENITHVTKQGTKEFGLANTNKLLKMAADFQVTGLKTGSTSRAKYCLSATAQKDGIRLIAVIMAAPDYKARFSDARNLLSYGYARCRLYEDKEKMPLPEMKVAGGVKENVLLEAEGTFTWLSTEGEDLGKIEKKLELAEQMEAPLARGERAGMIAYYMDGEKLGELPVVTAEAVEKAGYIDQLQKLFGKWAGFRNKAA